MTKTICNIKWDLTDDVYEYNIDDCDIPTMVDIPSNIEDNDIADYLSNEYGFLVKSFEIIDYNKEFEYNGLKIDRGTWESAPIPICTKELTDKEMQYMVEVLYKILIGIFDKESIDEYIKQLYNGETYDDHIDGIRWEEEELLFTRMGCKYYEDMMD